MGRALAWWCVCVVFSALLPACAHDRALSQRVEAKPVARGTDDSVVRLIAEADAHLTLGLSELRNGHLGRARESFDRAVDVYLTAPGGALADPRLAEAYRRTLETVHAREIEALAAGDGLAEKPAEPAAIDEVRELVMETPPSEETRRTSPAIVQAEANDFPVELNDAVLTCIDLYQGRLRDWFAAALSRGGRYLPKIREVFAAEGLPQDLAYVALVESAFRPAALSRARAKGVWQFISATGRRYGLEQNWWIDERGDPEKATLAAARYLKDLYELFGDWNLALAGYNAGEAKVQSAIRRYRTRDFWQLARTRAMRRETRNYVPLIHAAIVVAKAPDRYGFEIVAENPPAFEMVPIQGAVDLRVIAECVGISVQDIQLLNPGLRRLATPAHTAFELKVPEGQGRAALDCVAAIPPEKRVTFRTHVVARGQTLSSIAARYASKAADIAAANGFTMRKRLAVGTELIIPVSSRAAIASRRVSEPRRPPVADADIAGAQRILYRIKPGDTLAGIASQYGTTVRDLQSWNGLRSSRIAAGDTLTIFPKTKF